MPVYSVWGCHQHFQYANPYNAGCNTALTGVPTTRRAKRSNKNTFTLTLRKSTFMGIL